MYVYTYVNSETAGLGQTKIQEPDSTNALEGTYNIVDVYFCSHFMIFVC